MKKVRPLFVILGLILLGAMWQIILLFMNGQRITNYPPKGTHIVMVGDSLGAGVGASTPEHGLVPVLERRLSVKIENMSVSGDTTHDALMRIPAVIAKKPDILILELGGNDALKHVSRDETFANLRTMIGRVQHEGAVVILLGVRSGLIDDGEEQFASLAKETGTFYVRDILEGILGDPTLLADEVHPNDRGYEKIVDRIAPTLETAILGAGATP